MQKLLVSMLLFCSLCSFTKKKERPEPAFKKGYVTATASAGYPNFFRFYKGYSLGPFSATVDYQASRRFSFGLQYSYYYSTTGIKAHTTYTQSGSTLIPVYGFQFEQKITLHTFLATADYCYLNRGRVCLSSGLGLGYVPTPKISTHFLDNISHTESLGAIRPLALAFRLRLVNMKARITNKLGVCGGIGYGTDGLVSVGANYTFTGRK